MPGARGFASMDASKQREIASKGGRAAHMKGTAHQFTSEEARIAGSKGGRAARQKRLLRDLALHQGGVVTEPVRGTEPAPGEVEQRNAS